MQERQETLEDTWNSAAGHARDDGEDGQDKVDNVKDIGTWL
jgi:hypothetical protein